MGLDAVLEKIKDAGEAECKSMKAEAEADAEKITGKAKTEAENAEKKHAETVSAEIERLRTQELSSAEIEARKTVLNAQNDVLEKLRSSVLDAFGKLPKAKREAILKKLIAEASGEIPTGTIRCAKADVETVKKLVKYTMGDPIDSTGGFIVTSEDGSVTLDMRFETKLENIWNEHLRDITKRLFGEK
ncbi:MAG: V-type ATP synthase subunit E [Planctomycetota bacterium]|nr:MAG: V-type ATP synthase subunit E [Planctomycetota bacterium]